MHNAAALRRPSSSGERAEAEDDGRGPYARQVGAWATELWADGGTIPPAAVVANLIAAGAMTCAAAANTLAIATSDPNRTLDAVPNLRSLPVGGQLPGVSLSSQSQSAQSSAVTRAEYQWRRP